MLLMLAIRVGKSAFYYFNPELSKIFIRIGLYACILIGPALYFYFKSVVFQNVKIKNWLIHSSLLLLLSLFLTYLFPESHNPKVFGFSWMNIIYLTWFSYVLASGKLIWQSLKRVFYKKEKTRPIDFWLISILLGNLIVLVAYKMVGYVSYITGAISFSFIFYILFVLLYFRKNKTAVFNESLKYKAKKIQIAEAKELEKKLEKLVKIDKVYKQSDLKLSDVAAKMSIPPHTLSQYLNDNLEKGFSQFINEHRINEAKYIIGNDSDLKIESVAFDCGFSSKSTFNAAFKKIAGTTPTQFKEGYS